MIMEKETVSETSEYSLTLFDGRILLLLINSDYIRENYHTQIGKCVASSSSTEDPTAVCYH
jgi:hypothetical protein